MLYGLRMTPSATRSLEGYGSFDWTGIGAPVPRVPRVVKDAGGEQNVHPEMFQRVENPKCSLFRAHVLRQAKLRSSQIWMG